MFYVVCRQESILAPLMCVVRHIGLFSGDVLKSLTCLYAHPITFSHFVGELSLVVH